MEWRPRTLLRDVPRDIPVLAGTPERVKRKVSITDG